MFEQTANKLALKARKGVTFTAVNVPDEWQRIHGKIVYRAKISKNKNIDLRKFGNCQPYIMCSILGLKKESDLQGDFSII